MIKIEIKKTKPIDMKERAFMRASSSRIIAFKDGLQRHVTLTNWHWAALDWLVRGKKWNPASIPGLAYDMACLSETPGAPAFEDELRKSLWQAIQYMAITNIAEENKVANDDGERAILDY